MSKLTNNFIEEYNNVMKREVNEICSLMDKMGVSYYMFASMDLLYREGASTKLDHINFNLKGQLRFWCTDKTMGRGDCDARAFAYGELSKVIDVLNVEILHQSNEYKQLMRLLALEPNLSVDIPDCSALSFSYGSENCVFKISSFTRDDRGNLRIYGYDGHYNNLAVAALAEKDIKPEYLKPLIKYILDNADIINTLNGHDKELVSKINTAWKNPEYRERFGDILYAIGCRDKEEILEKLDIKIECNEDAMDNAHEIMEHVCDDMDLQTILSFIRYTDKK